MSSYTPLLAMHDILAKIKGCSSDKWRFVPRVVDGTDEGQEVSVEYTDGMHWVYTLKSRGTSVLITFPPGLLDADFVPERDHPTWLSDGEGLIRLSNTLEVAIDWGWDSCSCMVSPDSYESSELHRKTVHKLLLLAHARLLLKLGVAPITPIRPLE